MVDENSISSTWKLKYFAVQIPLWSMKTEVFLNEPVRVNEFRFLYGRWKPSDYSSITPAFARSDSSMVDENVSVCTFPAYEDTFRFLYGRWKRANRLTSGRQFDGFRFLYGRWKRSRIPHRRNIKRSSDSSMVDENPLGQKHSPHQCQVQIPLWSMKTSIVKATGIKKVLFRFLYGRWKHCHQDVLQ